MIAHDPGATGDQNPARAATSTVAMHRIPTTALVLVSLSTLACGADVPIGGAEGFDAVGIPDTGGTDGSESDDAGTEGSTSTTSGSTDADADADAETDAGVKFDLEGPGDLGDGGCGEGAGELEFSYIWVTSSELDVVSKIDTVTTEELARYRTTAVDDPQPSRTSVNRRGDVVVANRSGGGVTKVYAQIDDCVDADQDMQITTSQGPDDILPWGEDECVAWNQPLAGKTESRPVAWTNGTFDEGTCTWTDMKVWASASAKTPGSIAVYLLDGETGAIEQSVDLDIPLDNLSRGMYGAAVDEDDNVWLSQFGTGRLVRVDRDDLGYESWPVPTEHGSYGMSYGDGAVWLSGGVNVVKFSIEDESWTILDSPMVYGRGCMYDSASKILYVGSGPGLTLFDTESNTQVGVIDLPTNGPGIWGVGIDFEGYVWAVPNGDPPMFKIDPDTFEYVEVIGPPKTYTYSDMTGFLLSSVAPVG